MRNKSLLILVFVMILVMVMALAFSVFFLLGSGKGTVSPSKQEVSQLSSQRSHSETFASKEGRFSIEMPSEPLKETIILDTVVGDLVMYTYTSKEEKTDYVVAYMDYPEELMENYNLKMGLDGARDGMIKSTNGVLLSETSRYFEGYSGREINIKAGDGSFLRYRIFIVDNRIYIMGVGSEKMEELSSYSTIKFLDSFSLTN